MKQKHKKLTALLLKSMKEALRHDFYIVFRSITIMICMVLCALYALVGPLSACFEGGHNSILVNLGSSSSGLPLIVMVFAIAFCTRDFASGYIKNTYISSKKICYILSKIIVLFTFAVAAYLGLFLLQTIVNAARGDSVMYSLGDRERVALWKFILIELLKIGISATIGMVVLALACICKYGIVVAIVSLVYYSMHSYLEQGVNAVIGHGCQFEYYSLFGGATNIGADLPSSWQWICFGVMLGCGILSFLIAWLAYAKKNY